MMLFPVIPAPPVKTSRAPVMDAPFVLTVSLSDVVSVPVIAAAAVDVIPLQTRAFVVSRVMPYWPMVPPDNEIVPIRGDTRRSEGDA